MLERAGTIAIWLLATLIAVFFALLETDSALSDQWLPRANDSFYHARRILDAAVGARGFYQFDERLHYPTAPIPWPWAYDYLIKATQPRFGWRDRSTMAFISTCQWHGSS
jgi:asparagine N-glycosylation enzyme membrane subunit Stt3